MAVKVSVSNYMLAVNGSEKGYNRGTPPVVR